MIVVLGPKTLAAEIAAAHLGELVVGAGDDPRLSAATAEAARTAATLPLPARACVVAVADAASVPAALEAVRDAGGSLLSARVFVLGDPGPSAALPVWRRSIERNGAVPTRDIDQLVKALARGPEESLSVAELNAQRPGAPEAAAWRDALRGAPRRGLRLGRRRTGAPGRMDERALEALIRTPLEPGCHTVAVISPKGGVGKTLLSLLLGTTLARVRGDRVLVVDTNPDFGTLADLVHERVPATISDLMSDLRFVRSDTDIASYTTATASGMRILAAPQDPVEMGRLGAEGYAAVSDVLERHHDVVVHDCGTGFLDEITQFALRRADHVVVVSVPQLVTSKIIMSALEHLAAGGANPAHITLALNQLTGDEALDRGRLQEVLAERVGGIVELPLDLRLRRDLDLGEFDDKRLGQPMRHAIKHLAAEVVRRLPRAAVGPSHTSAPIGSVERLPSTDNRAAFAWAPPALP